LTGQFLDDYLQQHPELGEDGFYYRLFGGLHPLAIRNEVQRVIVEAREELAALVEPRKPRHWFPKVPPRRSPILPPPGPQGPSPEVPQGPDASETTDALIPSEKMTTEG
jgi:hypothetical protein